jgi:hypothetical protein
VEFSLENVDIVSQNGTVHDVMTKDHDVESQRQIEAREFLREQGISLYNSPWHGRTVELVDVIRAGLEQLGGRRDDDSRRR